MRRRRAGRTSRSSTSTSTRIMPSSLPSPESFRLHLMPSGERGGCGPPGGAISPPDRSVGRCVRSVMWVSILLGRRRSHFAITSCLRASAGLATRTVPIIPPLGRSSSGSAAPLGGRGAALARAALRDRGGPPSRPPPCQGGGVWMVRGEGRGGGRGANGPCGAPVAVAGVGGLERAAASRSPGRRELVSPSAVRPPTTPAGPRCRARRARREPAGASA